MLEANSFWLYPQLKLSYLKKKQFENCPISFYDKYLVNFKMRHLRIKPDLKYLLNRIENPKYITLEDIFYYLSYLNFHRGFMYVIMYSSTMSLLALKIYIVYLFCLITYKKEVFIIKLGKIFSHLYLNIVTFPLSKMKYIIENYKDVFLSSFNIDEFMFCVYINFNVIVVIQDLFYGFFQSMDHFNIIYITNIVSLYEFIENETIFYFITVYELILNKNLITLDFLQNIKALLNWKNFTDIFNNKMLQDLLLEIFYNYDVNLIEELNVAKELFDKNDLFNFWINSKVKFLDKAEIFLQIDVIKNTIQTLNIVPQIIPVNIEPIDNTQFFTLVMEVAVIAVLVFIEYIDLEDIIEMFNDENIDNIIGQIIDFAADNVPRIDNMRRFN